MMNFVRCRHTFSNQSLVNPARLNVPHLPAKKPIPTSGNTSATKLIFRPVPPNINRTTIDWTAIGWPTNIQSGTPDGKFGPAKQMKGWRDCWFLAPLEAVVNDEDGQKIMQESIKAGDGGYEVRFKGLPNKSVFISQDELRKCLDENGGDADTRFFELAADKFFNTSGNFNSLFIATFMRGGMNKAQAEHCLNDYCRRYGIQDSRAINPMREGGFTCLAFVMFTGMYPDVVDAASRSKIKKSDVMSFLKRYVNYESNGGSVAINGNVNPLGNSDDSRQMLKIWDLIRTDITSKRPLSPQQQAFLNALAKWLEKRNFENILALRIAANALALQHINLSKFVDLLFEDLLDLTEEHFKVLRVGVLEVLGGGSGYIGFPGDHSGTIEGINEAAGTFTYCEPYHPELVHTGELSDLIQATISGDVHLSAIRPTTRRDDSDRDRSDHAGTSRGRRLRQLHNQMVRDGKIDHAESGPLANLMAMDAGAFRQVYDSDKNGVIEGDELKAVQLRVARWVEHLELTPIW